jgi:hypothetical protein
MLHVIETAASQFFLRAVTGENAGRDPSQVDADYQRAAHLAALALPYRYPRLSAVKVAGDPSNPMQFKDNATAEELRAEIERRINILQKAGILELQVIEPEVQ